MKTAYAALIQAPNPSHPPTLFHQQFIHLSTWELLEHFHHRPHIHFVPLIDDEYLNKSQIDATLRNVFTFNHERHHYPEGVNWLENPSRDIEWLILLHKCYYFVGLGYHYRQTGERRYLDQWIRLTDSWMIQTKPGFIASDVTGRRIQNWIYAFYYFVHRNSKPSVPEDFLLRFLYSLHQQVSYLRHHLSRGRNHRTLELYSLFLAAIVFPEFRDASHWLEFSIDALTENAQHDILPDGVHCELSTFYHHIVLKNLLAIKQLAQDNHIEFPAGFDEAVCRALEFSLWSHKPDGKIPSLSDGDTGCFHELLEQGDRLYGNSQLRFASSFGGSGEPPLARSRVFNQSGYCILRSPWQNKGDKFTDGRYLIFDCGPLGAGNHGHLDLLNIEVAAYGRALIVDPGRYTYDEGGETNWRVRFRSTNFHNTVQVDGKNQARYEYSPRHRKFRITGPQPEPELREFVTTSHFDYVHGIARSHEYTATHERKIFFAAHDYWVLCDHLEDEIEHDYCLRFHLSPEAQGSISSWRGPHAQFVDSPNLLLVQIDADADFRVDPGYISPTYGIKHPVPTLAYDRRGRHVLFTTLLLPYRDKPPLVDIIPLQPQSEASTAFHCLLRTGQQVLHDYYFIAHGREAGHWHFDAVDCYGRFCHLRLDAEGRPLHAFALPGGQIRFNAELQPAEGTDT